MENWGHILLNHLLGFTVLLFIIGIINIWIAWKLCKEIIKSRHLFEDIDLKQETRVAQQIELIKKESW